MSGSLTPAEVTPDLEAWFSGEVEEQCQMWRTFGQEAFQCVRRADWLLVQVPHSCARPAQDRAGHVLACEVDKVQAERGLIRCGPPCLEVVKLKFIERIR